MRLHAGSYPRITLFVCCCALVLVSSCRTAPEHFIVPDVTYRRPEAFTPDSRLMMLDEGTLDLLQRRWRQGDVRLGKAVAMLLKQADAALTAGPFSVMNKSGPPPGGDMHDYYSLSIYHWPDPLKKDGMPYVRRDGLINPASRSGTYDKASLTGLFRTVGLLSLAFHYTGDHRYIERAAVLVRVWFINPETRMNPNMTYAQVQPGAAWINGSGIIETAGLIDLLDNITLIRRAGAFSDKDMIAFKGWLSSYLIWLFDSPQGRKEAASPNNHGVWFDVQTAAYALFIGDAGCAARILSRRTTLRMDAQVAPDGSLPRELARTRSFHYTLYVLEAFIRAARLGEKVGVDLWHRGEAEGKGIRTALDFAVRYVNGDKGWPYAQIRKEDEKGFVPALVMAARVYGDREFVRAARRLLDDDDGHYVHTVTDVDF